MFVSQKKRDFLDSYIVNSHQLLNHVHSEFLLFIIVLILL